jgi:hypothetical protein
MVVPVTFVTFSLNVAVTLLACPTDVALRAGVRRVTVGAVESTTAACGVTDVDRGEAVEPPLLLAITVKVYGVPLVSPGRETLLDVAAADTVALAVAPLLA